MSKSEVGYFLTAFVLALGSGLSQYIGKAPPTTFEFVVIGVISLGAGLVSWKAFLAEPPKGGTDG